MARAYFTDVAVDIEVGGAPLVLEGVEVTVTKRDGDPVQIFDEDEGGAARDNPFITDASGDMSFWAEPGKYKVHIVDTNPSPRFDPRDIYWDAVPYDSLIERTPAGTLVESACRFAPEGWMVANGAAVSRATYSDLWDALRTDASGTLTSSSPHGNGNGTSTFNLPVASGGTPNTNWIVRI